MAKKLTFAKDPLQSGPAMTQRDGVGIPYREISLASIERDANQPRTHFDEDKLNELASSIKTYGVLSPVLVRPSKLAGRYQLIAGERRVRACRMAGLTSIPAMVDGNEEDVASTLSIQLVENLQRSDLTSLEKAHAVSVLKDQGLSIRDISDKLGISKSSVQRSLSLLELPDDLLNALLEGASESKVLAISKVESREERAELLKNLDNLTRGDILKETGADKGKTKNSQPKPAREISPEDKRIADEIQRALGLKVRLNRTAQNSEAGKLSIEFYSDEDLQELFRKLVSEA